MKTMMQNVKRQVERDFIGEYFFTLPDDKDLWWWDILFEFYTAK